jgi:hypothetical protein
MRSREIRSRRLDALVAPGFAALAAFAALFAGVLAVGAARADEPERHEKIRLVWNADGATDRLELEDVELAPGESRDVVTESGRTARLTRDEDGEGMTLDVEGKQIRIDDHDGLVGVGEAGDGQRVIVRKRVAHPGEGEAVVLGEDGARTFERKIVVDEDGERKTFVVGDGDPNVLFLEGLPGEHGFAFSTEGAPLRLPHETLLERIEKSEKFLALDDATREIVREVVRDAAPKWQMKRVAPGEAGVESPEGAEDDAVMIWVEREVEESED